MSRDQAGLHVTENPWFLFPGQRVSQFDKVAIGNVRRQKGFVEKQNATVCRFDGFHRCPHSDIRAAIETYANGPR
jgi:hypothetical protein